MSSISYHLPGRIFCLLSAVFLIVGCERPFAKPSKPSPTPTPEPGFVGVATPTPTLAPPAKSLPPPKIPPQTPPVEEVSAPVRINTDAADAGNRAMRAEVLRRIDVMPNLGDEEKDKLYVQVERARAMGKLISIPFASGARTVDSGAMAGVSKALTLPQVEKFSGDPTVVFVVLGFADKKGDPKMNQTISLQRAESVVDLLKKKFGVVNLVHAVGMGGSEMFDSGAREKNRLVEVWAVLP